MNPIEIFFLQFLPEDKRCFGCENIRIIGKIDDMSSEWAFNRFEYYMGAITGGRFSKPFIDRGVPVSRFAESEIGSKLRDAQYLKGRSCMKAELLEYLRPLGTVVDFGKSVDLEAWIDRGKGADDEGQGRYSLLELREQVKKHPRNKTGTYKIFTHGCHVHITQNDINQDCEKIEISARVGGLQDYFHDLAKKQNPGPKSKKDPYYRSIGNIKSEMKKYQYFDDVTCNKTRFVVDFLIPKLQRLGSEVYDDIRRA